jgi:hypothetical protein
MLAGGAQSDHPWCAVGPLPSLSAGIQPESSGELERPGSLGARKIRFAKRMVKWLIIRFDERMIVGIDLARAGWSQPAQHRRTLSIEPPRAL